MLDLSWLNTPVLRTGAVVGVLGTVALLGCAPQGNYRVVKKVNTGGELALEGQQEPARAKAEAYMKGQCPAGYDIVEEGEAVVGQVGSAETRPKNSFVFGPSTATKTETTDKREWRIKFQCKGTAAGAPAGTQGQIHEVIVRF